MKIALASPGFPSSVDDALNKLASLVKEAAGQQASIICFPETFIPGYPLPGYQPEPASPEKLQEALEKACRVAAEYHIAIILPMDWYEGDRFLNLAFVISQHGDILGYQTKNQLDPTEDNRWIAGTERKIWEIDGLRFGITICHEGFRYPESVRWSARQGAMLVFHPQCTSSNISGAQPVEWGHKDNPYYEKAMMMRALENTIWFASVNYAATYQDSATSLVAPDGRCVVHQPYGKECVITAEIDPAPATGLLAKRFRPEVYNKND